MLDVSVVTIHPEFIESYLKFGALSQAIKKGFAKVNVINLRDFAVDRHGSVDGSPYGGGDGMVMRCEPLAQVIQSFNAKPTVLLTSPIGKKWDQSAAEEFSAKKGTLCFICGRFSGVDQRFIDEYVDMEISVGDFVLTGGELPALTILDSVFRLIPGVLGNEESAVFDSFAAGMEGLLEHPVYTRPKVFEGKKVPDILLSGDHKSITKWRRDRSLERTMKLRPELIKKNGL